MRVTDNTHGIDLDSWYKIGTPESHTYERAECYPYAGYFVLVSPLLLLNTKDGLKRQHKKCIKKGFFFTKEPNNIGQSLLQDLEEGSHSGQYLLVYINPHS